jgi:hypothetical protein
MAAVGLTKACRCARVVPSQTIKPYYDMSKFFPFSDITRILKIFQIHGQTTKPYFIKDITTSQNIFQIHSISNLLCQTML